MIEIRNFYYWW